MTRLKDILEPGEAIVRRYPSRGFAWMLVAICIAGIAIGYIIGPPLADGAGEIFLVIMAPVVPVALIAGYLACRWKILVTEKRIVVRQGPAGLGGIEQIKRGDILEIGVDDKGIQLRGSSKVVSIGWTPLDRRRVLKVVDPGMADAGRPAGRLSAILDSGERIGASISRPWSAWVQPEHPGIVFVLLGVAHIFVNPGAAKWVGVAGFIILGLWPLLISAQQVMRSGGWWVAVTDRRLIKRFEFDPMRYDEIALSDIVSVERPRRGNRLVVRGAGKMIEIPVARQDADRISSALGRTAEEAR